MKKYFRYILLCLFFFLCLLLFYNLNRGDLYVNYGFSYAISKFQLPYKDFNIVIPPLAPILYSIGLFINKSLITYYLEQAILLTFLFSIINKILKQKAYLFLLVMLIPYPINFSTTIFPGYNFLTFFLFIILIYCELTKKSDTLIGIILGLIFCSKQTLGITLFIPNLYFLIKNKTKFFSRLKGYFIPLIFLLVYLLLTNTTKEFFDLCFLGLINFGTNNNALDYFYLILFLLGLILLGYKALKSKQIIYFYGLCYSIIALPILDCYHTCLFLLAAIFLFLIDYKLKYERASKYYLIFTFSLALIWTFVELNYLQAPKIVNYKNFPLTLVSKSYDADVRELNNYTKTLKKRKIYLLRGSENYFFKIMHNESLNYFDLPNYGNYGYNGINKMLKKIKNTHDVYFILDEGLQNDTNKYQQYITSFMKEAKKNSKMVNKIGTYEVYYRE